MEHLHAVLLCVLRAVSAVEELPLEELDGNDGEDEHEELVDDEDVEDVLEGGHDAVEDGLQERAQLAVGSQQPWHGAGPKSSSTLPGGRRLPLPVGEQGRRKEPLLSATMVADAQK